MKKLATLTLSALAMILLMGMSLVPDNKTFEDWDKNDNGLIARSEFVDVFTDDYVNDWNVIDDAHLDDEDFYTVTYGIWDVDDDELLTEEEWWYGYDYYFGDYIYDDYVAIDTDGDGFIEYAEYYDALYDTDYYAVWDVDKDTYLDQYELARMVFNNWDYDNSNFIEFDEYIDFDSYYLDI